MAKIGVNKGLRWGMVEKRSEGERERERYGENRDLRDWCVEVDVVSGYLKSCRRVPQ